MKNYQNHLFENISEENCCAMLECFQSTEKSFSTGEVILDLGRGCKDIGILEEGKASLIRIDANGNRTILERLESGSVFGELLSFAGVSDDSMFVLCEKKCTVTFIGHDQVTKRCSNACLHHTLLVENLLNLISNRALYLRQRIEVLSQRSIRCKLQSYFNLCQLETDSSVFQLPLSMTALADYICVDRSAMMREMKHMKDEGLLDIDKRTITLLN